VDKFGSLKKELKNANQRIESMEEQMEEVQKELEESGLLSQLLEFRHKRMKEDPCNYWHFVGYVLPEETDHSLGKDDRSNREDTHG
jgi:predicted RNase H-like nuclease (RuvC/YqgF family)